MLYYRQDVLDELGVSVPQTWDELIEILPTIQGNNMSVGIPFPDIAAPNLSVFYSMVYQYGGMIYDEGGGKTIIDSKAGNEAFKRYTSLFTDYGLPTIFDFASRFRAGEMPIGINDYTVFNTLAVSAPEIRGLWNFTVLPGVERVDEKGKAYIDRSVHSQGASCMMIATDNPTIKNNAWAFMKWWVSTDAQVRFGREIESVLGSSARYARANQFAFEQLAWSAAQVQIIRQQMEKAVGYREVPGGYYTPRHLTNAIRKVINDHTDTRETLQDYARILGADFGKGAYAVTVYAKAEENAGIKIMLDSPDGECVGEVRFIKTGTFMANHAALDTPITGVHDLYFVFTGNAAQMASWQFSSEPFAIGTNPLIKADFPDADVIRVGDIYYKISTTMHFMPGGVILRSFDLIHWEIATRVYDVLEQADTQRLDNGKDAYGKGMWAASLRYHRGTYYVCFVANDTGKTYLYRAENIQGPWRKSTIAGFYHDCSLVFDEDGRVYIFYGNKSIWATELKSDLSAPKPGGLHREVVNDEGHPGLGYEGTHAYKINGRYYLFFIHSLRTEWKRTQACFVSDSLEGEFSGGDVLNDDMGYFNAGVAQGGIVDTPDGDWYAILFQDRGAVGRIPVLVPVSWANDYPAFHQVPIKLAHPSTRPGHVYAPVVDEDDFSGEALKAVWEWNHSPKNDLWQISEGFLEITTGRIAKNLLRAHNTLTQRTREPVCEAIITIDASDIKQGDYAGLCALQSRYGFIAITKQAGVRYLVMVTRSDGEDENGTGQIRVKWEGDQVTVKIIADFTHMKDRATFWYLDGATWKRLGGELPMRFTLDHFTGYRFGLFNFATEQVGGMARFSDFIYN